jgi:hypothetical protein
LDLCRHRSRPSIVGHESYWYSTRSPVDHATRIVRTAHLAGVDIAFSADLAPDLLVPWRHPTLTIVYAGDELDLASAGLVPAEGRADASVIVRCTDDRTLLTPQGPWPASAEGFPLVDPTQQWWDLLDLGGEDRREAADRLRASIVGRTIPGGRWRRSAMASVGNGDDYRLIGSVAVMLHIQRLGLDLPLRATGDADFGVPLQCCAAPTSSPRSNLSAIGESEATAGNDHSTKAASQQSISSFPHTRHGLADALRRPDVSINAELHLTDGALLGTGIVLPDPIGLLANRGPCPLGQRRTARRRRSVALSRDRRRREPRTG